jgi:alkylhydroperoxidase family enzyme
LSLTGITNSSRGCYDQVTLRFNEYVDGKGDETRSTAAIRPDTMARIQPLLEDNANPESRAALDEIRAAHGRVTNMKRTLARSPVALHALMTWYDLRNQVVPFLGERPTTLFAHAISAGTDCLVCSTFFRRMLIDAGEDPEALRLDDWEQTIVAYGRQLAVDPHGVSDELYGRLAARLEPDQIVALTAFGGLMVATNLFNNALQVDLDEYLHPYRRETK